MMQRTRQIKHWPANPLLWLGVMVGLYLIFFLALTLTSHAAFRTSALDLGIYDQVVWNTAHGRILEYSAEPSHGSSFLATHLQPILILLAPLYWVWSDVRGLIILQTLVIAASAVPVYLLASWQLRSGWAALAMVFAYLMFPALQAVNGFVFHPESFEPLLLLSAVVLFEVTRNRLKIRWLSGRKASVLLVVALVLALAVKEDVALILIAAGAYLFIFRKERRFGLALMGGAALWFAAGMFGIMPLFRAGKLSPFFSRYSHLGSTPVEIGRTLLTRPDFVADALLTRANGTMLLSLLLPLAMLPLLDLGVLLIAAPVLFAYGLSNNLLMQRMEEFQYAAPIIPIVTAAAIYGLGTWRKHRGLARLLPAALGVLLICSLVYQRGRGFTPLSRLFDWPVVSQHDQIGESLVRQIPDGAPLVAQDTLYPHLSQREAISFLWPTDSWAEYIFLDVSDPGLHNGDNLSAWLREQIEQRTDYGLVASEDGYLLLKRGAPPSPFSEQFYSFATPEAAAPRHPLPADTDDGIRFVGYDVLRQRDAGTQLVLYWAVTQQPERDHFVRIYLLSEQDEVLGKTVFQQPALVWYPTSSWQAGQTVRVVANTMPWPAEPDRFGFGLSVLEGDDPGQDEQRLRWRPVPGEAAPRLLEDGTILWLGEFAK
jgi:uncharacterized membrane protein